MGLYNVQFILCISVIFSTIVIAGSFGGELLAENSIFVGDSWRVKCENSSFIRFPLVQLLTKPALQHLYRVMLNLVYFWGPKGDGYMNTWL